MNECLYAQSYLMNQIHSSTWITKENTNGIIIIITNYNTSENNSN